MGKRLSQPQAERPAPCGDTALMSTETGEGSVRPVPGDRILILRPHWLACILTGQKTLELRHRRLKPGQYFLGYKERMYGVCTITSSYILSTYKAFRDTQHLHCCAATSLPYKCTYAHEITDVSTVPLIQYYHPRGAVGVVVYRGVSGLFATEVGTATRKVLCGSSLLALEDMMQKAETSPSL